MNYILNALLVTTMWILPLIFTGSIIDQQLPPVDKNETNTRTVILIVLQLVLSFLIFEGIEKMIQLMNTKIIKGIRMPEIISGALLIGTVQANTQLKLGQRIRKIYNLIYQIT